MQRANFPSAFDRNIQKDILDEFMAAELIHNSLTDVRPSKRKSEKISAHSSFIAMPQKQEGAKWAVDDPVQRYTYELTALTYALAFKATQEMVEDDELALVQRLAKSLGRSASETINVTVANLYNRAFNSSFTYGDGIELCATDHPTIASTEQNELTTAADLANSSLDEARYTMSKTVDHRGKLLFIRAIKLIVPSELEYTADLIVDSQFEYNASNGAQNKNFFRGKLLPQAIPYLTDSDAWFLMAATHGMVFYNRIGFSTGRYIENETGDLVHFARMRFSTGSEEWRGIFGTPGAD